MELKIFHPIVTIIENMHDIVYFISSDAKSRPQKYHLKRSMPLYKRQGQFLLDMGYGQPRTYAQCNQ